ncbi:MAG: polyhydroxybutyrate depolymerase [Crocinitomicaceae bacterium]|jgi:polyhydroxybutyrate depolymerase
MFKIKSLPLIALTLCCLQWTTASAQVELTDSIWHNGMYRSYIIHIPPGYTGTMAYPLVYILHGGGAGGAQKVINEHHFDEVADTANYLAVFPNGVFNSWADGRGTTDASIAGIDDISFLNALIDTLEVDYYIDTNKVYICGGSNGGMMTQTMACQSPDKFAAFGTIISSLPDSVAMDCLTTSSTNMLIMNGTEDNLIPYEGGVIGVSTAGGSVIGTDSTIAFWLDKNGSPNTPDSMSFPDIVTTDNGIVKLFSYPLGLNGSEVVLFKMIGAGHTVPGQLPNWVQIPLLGYVNRDINAAQEIWKFFSRHCRNEVVALEEIDSDERFMLYPNPAKELVTIRSKNNEPITGTLKIVDLSGKALRSILLEGATEQTLNVSGIDEGSYLLYVIIKDWSSALPLIIQ